MFQTMGPDGGNGFLWCMSREGSPPNKSPRLVVYRMYCATARSLSRNIRCSMSPIGRGNGEGESGRGSIGMHQHGNRDQWVCTTVHLRGKTYNRLDNIRKTTHPTLLLVSDINIRKNLFTQVLPLR